MKYGYYWVVKRTMEDGCTGYFSQLSRHSYGFTDDLRKALKWYSKEKPNDDDFCLADGERFVRVKYRKGTELPKLERLVSWMWILSYVISCYEEALTYEDHESTREDRGSWCARYVCLGIRVLTRQADK